MRRVSMNPALIAGRRGSSQNYPTSDIVTIAMKNVRAYSLIQAILAWPKTHRRVDLACRGFLVGDIEKWPPCHREIVRHENCAMSSCACCHLHCGGLLGDKHHSPDLLDRRLCW